LFFQLFLVSIETVRVSTMPIYEYRCRECGFEKDALQKMSAPPLVDCPQCGKPALVKLVSAAGFQLKGSGWYATDFKSSGAKPAVEKSDATKPDGAKTDAKSESGGPAAAGTGEGKSSEKASTTGESAKPALPPSAGG
jgi:putative FmdB family regulatory protein